MTNKEYLSQYQELWKDIKIKMEEAESLRSRAEKVTALLSDLPKGQGGQGFTGAADKLMELQMQIDRDIFSAINKRDEIETVIEGISNPTYRRVLHLIYINGSTLKTISEFENYSYDRICHIHGEALKKIVQP